MTRTRRVLYSRRVRDLLDGWPFWVVLGVAGLLVFGSYRVYHPLSSPGTGVGSGSDGSFRVLELDNSGFADLTIVRVGGGALGGPWRHVRLPYELRSRSSAEVYVAGPTCSSRTVAVTYSVLGRASTQRFPLSPQECHR